MLNSIQVNDHVVVFPDNGVMAVRLDAECARSVLSSIPGIRYKDEGKTLLCVLPWTMEACKFAANCGAAMEEATPLVIKGTDVLVEGTYAPMRHQLASAAFLCLHNRSYNFSECRTGKTASAIIALDYMQKHRMITGAALIITTMTTMGSVWADSITSTLPGVKVTIVHGQERDFLLDTPADFYITNYDSVRLSTKAFVRAVQEGRIGATIVDELTHAGNISSQRWKALNAVINRTNIPYACGLTGSPGDNVFAALGMGLLINAKKMPCTTKKGWERRVSYQWGDQTWKRSLFSDAGQRVMEVLQPAIRYKKADIISLPPVLKQRRSCELSAAQRKVMQALRSEGAALLESGAVITAVNGGVLYGKMLQCALGFAVQKDGTVVDLPHEDRTQTIVECIQETTRKVVVFISYKHAIRQRCEEIRKAGMTCEFIDGSVTGKARADILHRFQTEPDPHVLICQPVTTSFGVEMSAADTLIFDGPVLAGGFTYTQALERLSSARQTAESISVISVLSEGAERKAWDSLDNTHKLGYNIAKLFEQAVKE